MSENIKNSAAGELSLNDFRLDGELQSDGAKLCRIGVNHFKLTLSGAPGHDDWANWIRLEIARNARGKRLRLEVEFPNSTNIFFFTNYAPCWSYDGGEWTYVQWTPGFTPGRFGVLEFPEFAEDRVLISAQMPMTLSDAARLTDTWARQPCVSIHLLGRSLGGRDLRRITVTDPGGPHPPARRWVHHVANQHPGEGVAQWYIAGMVNWLLSDEAAEHRKRSIWHFTLMMNPDGVAHGWCRVNKQGVDMNRSYRVRGADESAQCHEAYIFQRDFEELMRSESPVTASWSMHAWPRPNQLEPIIVGAGPEMRKDALGHWGGSGGDH
jgi:murein tripeptide amidase MpaA